MKAYRSKRFKQLERELPCIFNKIRPSPENWQDDLSHGDKQSLIAFNEKFDKSKKVKLNIFCKILSFMVDHLLPLLVLLVCMCIIFLAVIIKIK
jgi:hypothetical protein